LGHLALTTSSRSKGSDFINSDREGGFRPNAGDPGLIGTDDPLRSAGT
jgi:hypothetical protein